MMKPFFFVGVLGLAACAGSDDGGQPEQPKSCNPSSRSGSYFAEFETVSGDCGQQTSALIRLDADMDPADAGCARLNEDRWSDGNCTLERSTICPFDSAGAGSTLESVAITTQRDAAGDQITGTMTMTLKNAAGVVQCFGTYRFSAVRQ